MVPWAHLSQFPKRHLDRFSRFARRDRHTDTTQSVAIAASYAMHAILPNNNKNGFVIIHNRVIARVNRVNLINADSTSERQPSDEAS